MQLLAPVMRRSQYFELEQEFNLGHSDEGIDRWRVSNGAEWIYSQMITKASATSGQLQNEPLPKLNTACDL
jgi:hypothetical protein